MARRRAIAALSLAALLLVPARSGAADAEARKSYQVAAIGDSLTAARSHGGKYLAHLRRQCPESRFDNYGRGGENVQQMRRRFLRDVLGARGSRRKAKPEYSHVIVFGGINDVMGDQIARRTTAKILADLDDMYATARGAGIRVVGITLSPWAGYTRYYNPRRARTTREVNQWILAQWHDGKIDHAVDAHALLSCGTENTLCKSFEMRWIRDGLHFNDAAHTVLGQALHETVFADCR